MIPVTNVEVAWMNINKQPMVFLQCISFSLSLVMIIIRDIVKESRHKNTLLIFFCKLAWTGVAWIAADFEKTNVFFMTRLLVTVSSCNNNGSHSPEECRCPQFLTLKVFQVREVDVPQSYFRVCCPSLRKKTIFIHLISAPPEMLTLLHSYCLHNFYGYL